MRIELEVSDNKAEFFLELIKNLSFVKALHHQQEVNEITNPYLLQSIEDYESGKVKPVAIELSSLKEYGKTKS